MRHGSENRQAREKVRIAPDVLVRMRAEAKQRGIPIGEVVRLWMPPERATEPQEPPKPAEVCRYCGEIEHDAACPLWKEGA